MKKFILKTIIFFAIIAVIDIAFNHAVSAIVPYAKGEKTGRLLNIADSINNEVLILGSSRAIHHYNPQILADSLNKSVYNCGMDGNGIIFNFGQLELIKQRYTPDAIVYEVTPAFDLFINPASPNERFLGDLRMFYDRPGIKDIFISVNPTENIKMLSGMYRYNRRILSILKSIVSSNTVYSNGYDPHYETMDYDEPAWEKRLDVDSLKLDYLNRLAAFCHDNGIKLIFVTSPEYGIQDVEYPEIEEICRKYDFKYFNHLNLKGVCDNRLFFKDRYHMNYLGADTFSSVIAHEIKPILTVK